MTNIDDWMAGRGSIDILDPATLAELRNRFWRAEALDFASRRGYELDDDEIETLALALQQIEACNLLEEVP